VKIGGCANPDMVRLMREWLGPHGPRIVVGAVTVVGEDGDAARAKSSIASSWLNVPENRERVTEAVRIIKDALDTLD
jgi:hypothetical protein